MDGTMTMQTMATAAPPQNRWLQQVAISLLVLALLLVTSGPLSAQMRPIEERHTLRPDARVEINAIIHSITVERWDRNEIEITGEYDSEWEEIDVGGDERSFRFEVEAMPRNRSGRQNWNGSEARSLRVRAPAGVQLAVATVSGDLRVTGLSGSVSATSVSGRVEMEGGGPTRARLNSVSGGVRYEGGANDIEVQSVSGEVIVMTTGRVGSGSVKSVSGNVEFNGALAANGRLDVESHSGNVDLTLPPGVDARFSLSTFSGRVTSDLPNAEDEVHRRGQYVPQESLSFTTGSGSARVEAKSFSGNVRVRPGAR